MRRGILLSLMFGITFQSEVIHFLVGWIRISSSVFVVLFSIKRNHHRQERRRIHTSLRTTKRIRWHAMSHPWHDRMGLEDVTPKTWFIDFPGKEEKDIAVDIWQESRDYSGSKRSLMSCQVDIEVIYHDVSSNLCKQLFNCCLKS
jgi:hypothetical protein